MSFDTNASPDELARAMLLYRFCGSQMKEVQQCIETKGQQACQGPLSATRAVLNPCYEAGSPRPLSTPLAALSRLTSGHQDRQALLCPKQHVMANIACSKDPNSAECQSKMQDLIECARSQGLDSE